MMQITGIGLATPGKAIEQSDLLEIALRYNAESEVHRTRLKRIYHGSKVDNRHSVLSNNATESEDALKHLLDFYQPGPSGKGPSTHERMWMYQAHATALATQACKNALTNSRVSAESITQLITVSCTGFSAPGQDADLIDALGLKPTVARTNIGFMGCHAALNGLRIADALVRADPDQRVLLCCTELCTLHFQHGSHPQDAIANALFADGSAALVAQCKSESSQRPTCKSFHAEKVQATKDMMSWRIGDHGFQMRLEPRVPKIIGQTLRPSIASWLSELGLTVDAIGGWLIHPGGPKIIDAVEASLGLSPIATQSSRAILQSFGNMSSPTLLFILDAAIKQAIPKPWIMLGFGPGLAIEATLLV